MNINDQLLTIWKRLYEAYDDQILNQFISEIQSFKSENTFEPSAKDWYKDIVVYSLYVDLFNKDFSGLEEKLDYLSDLGVNCLWLLPVLDSPMRDAGFDISNYRKIRSELVSDANNKSFESFIAKTHQKGIKVIFDIAVNHTSEEHYWFQEAKKSENNPYRNYYIWNDTVDKYSDARIIFKGIEDSNWEKCGDSYFFHRFFNFQPDLNYQNPEVLFEMIRNFVYWLQLGVDGFRVDAIPYLWKIEGTACENHDETHLIMKFIRLVIDYLKDNVLLLAEACQRPNEVVKYFGNDDECNGAYHFPLMPQIFKAIASKNAQSILQILSTDSTPEIPANSQWFTFLRCHDELSLELVYVSEEDRKFIHESYCKNPEWDFRLGQGIASRISELLDKNPQKIGLAYSIMFSLPGTAVIYYGDEFGKLNDQNYYQEMKLVNGKDDTRFLVRGRIDWEALQIELNNPESFHSMVNLKIKTLIKTRNRYKAFGRGSISWVKAVSKLNVEENSVLMYERQYLNEKLLVINNLSDSSTRISIPDKEIINNKTDLLGNKFLFDNNTNEMILEPYSYFWLQI